MEAKNNINENLRYLRNQINFTIVEFSEVLGLTPSAYSAYEDARESIPKLSTIVSIKKYLNDNYPGTLTLDNLIEDDLTALNFNIKKANSISSVLPRSKEELDNIIQKALADQEEKIEAKMIKKFEMKNSQLTEALLNISKTFTQSKS